MENNEFEFLDRAISLIKENYGEQAAQLIADEGGLSINEARAFRDMLIVMMEG